MELAKTSEGIQVEFILSLGALLPHLTILGSYSTRERSLQRPLRGLVISTLSVILYITARIIDPKEMKASQNTKSRVMKEAQTKGDTRAKIQQELLRVQSRMLSMSMKPMLYTILTILVLFTWLGSYPVLVEAVTKGGGHIVKLPFALPSFGTQLGWIGWYVLCSFATSTLIKKVFNIEY